MTRYNLLRLFYLHYAEELSVNFEGGTAIENIVAIVEIINKYKWTNVVLVGGNFLKIEHPYISFNTSNEARKWLIEQNLENTHLLIKGSRSIKMEKVLES